MIEKKKNPTFMRQDAHKKKRLKGKWRSARGLQSKIRLAKKGYCKKPKTGYRNAKVIRGLVNGMESVEVSSVKELEKVPKTKGIIIKNIGLKKKIEVIKKALILKIKILNVKDADKFLKEKESEIMKKKATKKAKDNIKEKKKAEAEKTANVKATKEKESEIKEKSEEELEKDKKVEAEKKNKILTQKN